MKLGAASAGEQISESRASGGGSPPIFYLARGVEGYELESLGYSPRPLSRRSKADKKKAAHTERRRRYGKAPTKAQKRKWRIASKARLLERLGIEGYRKMKREEKRRQLARRALAGTPTTQATEGATTTVPGPAPTYGEG